MKLSTINAIQWSAIAIFWGLLVWDWATPGDATKLHEAAMTFSVYALLSAHFYLWGTKRKTAAPKMTANDTINETSN